MSSSCKRERGITLIESVIAILLLSVGLVGLLSMQPSAWKASVQADYVGHAAMILSQELSRNELQIMNPCNTVTVTDEDGVEQSVHSSGQSAAQSGDTTYTVTTTILAVAGSSNTWKVTVRVTWPPLNSIGIRESLIVTRQEPFRFPLGCTGV